MDDTNKIFDDKNENIKENGKVLYSRTQDICSLAETLNEINKEEEKEELVKQNAEDVFENEKNQEEVSEIYDEDNSDFNLGRDNVYDLAQTGDAVSPVCIGRFDIAESSLEDTKNNFSEDNAQMVIEEINIFNDNKEEAGKANVIEIFTIKKKLLKIKDEIEEILKDIDADENLKAYEKKVTDVLLNEKRDDSLDIGAAKIIEGVFDGFEMIAEDGEKYEVPANYASKSKLVEGDILKLRILYNGAYRYKQIEKVERRNSVGILNYNEESKEYFVVLDNVKKYKVLTASITYYKANIGDEIIITVPVSGESKWAAVEGMG